MNKKILFILLTCLGQSSCILKPLELGVDYLKDKARQCNLIIDIYVPKGTPYEKIKAIINSEPCRFTISYCDDCHTRYVNRDHYNRWSKQYKDLGLEPPHPKRTDKSNIFPPRHKRSGDYSREDLGLAKKENLDSNASKNNSLKGKLIEKSKNSGKDNHKNQYNVPPYYGHGQYRKNLYTEHYFDESSQYQYYNNYNKSP